MFGYMANLLARGDTAFIQRPVEPAKIPDTSMLKRICPECDQPYSVYITNGNLSNPLCIGIEEALQLAETQ